MWKSMMDPAATVGPSRSGRWSIRPPDRRGRGRAGRRGPGGGGREREKFIDNLQMTEGS